MLEMMQDNFFLNQYNNAIMEGTARSEAKGEEGQPPASWEDILRSKEKEGEKQAFQNRKKSKKHSRKEDYDWWAERMARHDLFMQLFLAGRGVYYSPHLTGLGSFPGSYSKMLNLKSLVALQAECIVQEKLHARAFEMRRNESK